MQKMRALNAATPISSVMRLIIGKSSLVFQQVDDVNPASGICKVKRSPSSSLIVYDEEISSLGIDF